MLPVDSVGHLERLSLNFEMQERHHPKRLEADGLSPGESHRMRRRMSI